MVILYFKAQTVSHVVPLLTKNWAHKIMSGNRLELGDNTHFISVAIS